MHREHTFSIFKKQKKSFSFLMPFFWLLVKMFLIYFLYIWLPGFLVAACGFYFSNQGSKPSPLHWELGVLANGPLWKSLFLVIVK